jgi:hypothetical protein
MGTVLESNILRMLQINTVFVFEIFFIVLCSVFISEHLPFQHDRCFCYVADIRTSNLKRHVSRSTKIFEIDNLAPL